MCICTPDIVLTGKMRISESSQNSAARVNLILDQCLQKKRLKGFTFIAK